MKLGVIAGNKLLPLLFCQSARSQDKDLHITALCFHGETSPAISRYADKVLWLKVGQLQKLVEIIQQEELRKLVMVGQINPRRIFNRTHWDEKMHKLSEDIDDFRPHTVFSRFIRTLEILGVEFLDSTVYMKNSLATEGMINQGSLHKEAKDDIEFGTSVVSKFVELDIGQTVVVKRKTVLALEALEGTDAAIARGYRIAGSGCVVLKFSKRDQDLRFDVPIVGMRTLKLLRRTGTAALVLEAGKVIILEKEKFLERATQWDIPVIGKSKTGM